MLQRVRAVVIFTNKTPIRPTTKFSKTMKTATHSPSLEKLSLTALISCACSVAYFVVTNLLA